VKNAAFVKRTRAKLQKSASKRRLVRSGLIGLNAILVLAVMAAVLFYPRHGSPTTAPLNSVAAESNQPANPLDQLASANIAVTVARMSGIDEATAVTNQADSESTELALASASSSVVAKPQVVTTSFKSNKDIIVHTVVAGDTVSSLASKYGVTSDSIRWSNNLKGESLQVGKVLYIPPEGVNGIVYTVVAGDTPASLARKFSSDSDKIIAFNFAEVSGLKVGERIVIPDGSKAAIIAARTTSSYYGWGGTAQYGYNGYDYGYCTWWVAHLRAQAGNPVPSNLGNASTWGYRAKAYGLPTGTTPRVGAAVVTSTRGAGHVAYVTAVNGDGTITISEMNHLGWNRTDTRTIADAGYTYIY
jgi:surface antigen